MHEKGEFERKRVEFLSDNFLKITNNFPDSRYADDCLFYAGKLYFDLMDYGKATDYFRKIIKNYKNGVFSKFSNQYEYKFHIAPLAHFLIARIEHFQKKNMFKAYWEYRQLIRKYARYADEKYILDGNVGYVFAEAQFYMAEIARKHFYDYEMAIKFYRRTVLRYTDVYWEDINGREVDFKTLAIKRMYDVALNHPNTYNLVIVNFKEMSSPEKSAFTDSKMILQFYLGELYLHRKDYRKAVNSFYNVFTTHLKIKYPKDVKIVLKALNEIDKLDDSKNTNVRNLIKQTGDSIDIAKMLLNKEVSDLLSAELLYFLAKKNFLNGNDAEAVKNIRKIYRKFPFVISTDSDLIVKRSNKILKKYLSRKAYINFLKKNLFFISNKFSIKEKLMKEVEKYENQKDS